MSDTEDVDLDFGSVFPEPPRPPSPEPTVSIYRRSPPSIVNSAEQTSPAWAEVKVRLVGSHPLWGHYLWNAARSFATYLDLHPSLYAGRNVLELGAGGGLPGIVTVLNGARQVVLTDYPDAALVDNLSDNVRQNVSKDLFANVSVVGYRWGSPVDEILTSTEDRQSRETMPPDQLKLTGFDLIILSDLIFNHSQHEALLRSCEMALNAGPPDNSVQSPPPCALVFYTHHRPHLAHRDMEFFDMARSRGWTCVEILTEHFPPMFPEDSGDEEVRSTVHGWKLTRRNSVCPDTGR